MADPPPYPDTGDDRDAASGRTSTAGIPRWLFVLAITVAVLLVMLLVVLHRSGSISPGTH